MPITVKAHEAGIFRPPDLALLQRVFDLTADPQESEAARSSRASRILAYFIAGERDEAALLEALKRSPSTGSFAAPAPKVAGNSGAARED